jgi:hypothetical protein
MQIFKLPLSLSLKVVFYFIILVGCFANGIANKPAEQTTNKDAGCFVVFAGNSMTNKSATGGAKCRACSFVFTAAGEKKYDESGKYPQCPISTGYPQPS